MQKPLNTKALYRRWKLMRVIWAPKTTNGYQQEGFGANAHERLKMAFRWSTANAGI